MKTAINKDDLKCIECNKPSRFLNSFMECNECADFTPNNPLGSYPDNSNLEPTSPFNQLALDISQEIVDTLIRKNHDYGNSFEKSYNKYGLVSTLIRLDDKISRLDSLSQYNKKQRVNDESIDDTLLDIAGYAILTLIARKQNHDK